MAIEGRAAVLNNPGEPVAIEEIVIDPPGPGEVLVRLVASGVCHTDLHVKNMQGSDWPRMKENYSQFLPHVMHRADVISNHSSRRNGYR